MVIISHQHKQSNSNVIFGNRVINPNNHAKYSSVFDLNGNFINNKVLKKR